LSQRHDPPVIGERDVVGRAAVSTMTAVSPATTSAATAVKK
jgi:hypothetical protein